MPAPRTGSRWDDHQVAGKADRLARSYVARMALAKVMYENRIDAFVHPENTVPTPKIQGPNVGSGSLDGITPFFQIPRIAVPAGVNDVIYEPAYALNADKTDYDSVLPPGTAATRLPHADADQHHVLRRPRRRADVDQGRDGVRVRHSLPLRPTGLRARRAADARAARAEPVGLKRISQPARWRAGCDEGIFT